MHFALWNHFPVAWNLLNQRMLLPTQYPGMPTFPSASMAIARSAEAALCWRLSCRVSATPEHAKVWPLQRRARHVMPPAACMRANVCFHERVSDSRCKDIMHSTLAVQTPLCSHSLGSKHISGDCAFRRSHWHSVCSGQLPRGLQALACTARCPSGTRHRRCRHRAQLSSSSTSTSLLGAPLLSARAITCTSSYQCLSRRQQIDTAPRHAPRTCMSSKQALQTVKWRAHSYIGAVTSHALGIVPRQAHILCQVDERGGHPGCQRLLHAAVCRQQVAQAGQRRTA